jgi:hypothetical protein
MRGSTPLLVAALVFTGACVHTGFQPTTGLALPPRAQGCYLDLIFHGQPPAPYIVIGRISTDSTAPGLFALGENDHVAVDRMKEEACIQGAHGLLDVGASSQGVWTGNGYSKSTSGGAVAFIYVDPSGRPLAPPNGPRVMIQGQVAVPAPPPPGYAPPAGYAPPPGAPPRQPTPAGYAPPPPK